MRFCTGIKLDERHWGEAEKRLIQNPDYKDNGVDKIPELGILGEVVLDHWFDHHKIDYQSCLSNRKFDYIANGLKIECKTKQRKQKPRNEYEASVFDYNIEYQDPDYYAFVCPVYTGAIMRPNVRRYTHAYIVGFIGYMDFIYQSFLWKEGDRHPCGTVFGADNWNVLMNQLIQPRDFLDRLL